MAIAQTDPNQPPTDPTLSTQPAKKPTAPASASTTVGNAPTLPVSTQPATPPAPSSPGLGASTQPAGSPAPALPVAPAQTSDPMAFQPPPSGSVYGGANQTGQVSIPGTGAGTMAYGLEWAPGSEPPPNLTPEQYQQWQAQNKGNVGYAPDVYSRLQQSGSAADTHIQLQKILDSGGSLTPEQWDQYGQAMQQLNNTWSPPITSVQSYDANVPGSVTYQREHPTGSPDPNAQFLQGGVLQDAKGNPIEGGYNATDDAMRQAMGLPPTGPDTSAASSTGSTLPKGLVMPGAANDVGTPSSDVGGGQATAGMGSIPISSGGLVQPPASPPDTGSPTTNPSGGTIPVNPSSGSSGGSSSGGPVGNGVSLTPTDPSNPLTAQTISVNPNVDRFQIAKQQIQDTIDNILNPQEAADSRTIAANSFGLGRGVSGQNRTAQGNLAAQYGRQKAQLTSDFLNPALLGTIQDAYNNAGIAQQQQQFQSGQQQTGFNQAVTAQQLADQENSQAFNQALQQLLVGSQGDPSQIALVLASIYGGQSAQNTQAAQNLVRSAGA